MEASPRDQNHIPALILESSSTPGVVISAKGDQVTGRLLVDVAGGSGTVTSVSVVSANGFAGSVATATTTPAITISTTATGILQGNGTAISGITDSSTVGQVLRVTGASTYAWGALNLASANAITGNLPVTSLNSGTSAGVTTFWRGDGTWSVPAGAGDVVGPASATDNAVARFDLTTGKIIQNSVVIIADTTGVISGTQGITLSGSSSGTLAIKTPAAAGSNTLTLPAGTTDFSATGGAGQFVKQNASGGALTVSAVAVSELSGLGTGVATALAVNVGSAGAFVTFNGALGTPSSGTVTNLTGTASININGTVGATTPAAATITTLIVTTGPAVIGHTATLSTGGITANLQQYGTTAGTAAQVIGMFNATAGTQSEMQFYRSKNAAIGSATVVASGDGLGKISWYGAQQTGTFATQTIAAQIRAEVDGTVTSGAGADMPGRIIFATVPDASGTITDRLILDSAGVLKPNANDGVPLGTATLSFADLFLASGGVINFNNGNMTITHAAGSLTVAGGNLLALGASTATSLTTSGENVQLTGSNTRLVVPTGDLTATGFINNDFNCGYSSSAIGDLVYLDSSSTWQKGDANTLLLYNGLLGVALEVKAAASALRVALPGTFIYSTTGFPTWTIGGPIYMSETAGAMTQTAPTTTDAATRVVGWGVHADKMYFFPSPDYVTHT